MFPFGTMNKVSYDGYNYIHELKGIRILAKEKGKKIRIKSERNVQIMEMCTKKSLNSHLQ